MSLHRVARGLQKSSRSTGQKVLRAFARGWEPGAGPISAFSGKRARKSFSPLIQPNETGGAF